MILSDLRVKMLPGEMPGREGRVALCLLVVEGEGAGDWAAEVGTIGGARWMVVEGDFAYACVPSREHLADSLRGEGFNVDDSDWFEGTM